MGIKDVAKRLAAGASVTLATSGLSSCRDGGGTVTDPPPPPFLCSMVGPGQSLTATARRSADTVNVTIASGPVDSMVGVSPGWQVDSVANVVGATLGTVRLPRPGSTDSLQVALRLPGGGTRASFTVFGNLFGWTNQSCPFRRTFTVDVTAVGVSVRDSAPELPLAARDTAQIVLGSRAGRVVELAARTTFAGPHGASWTVSGGELDASAGSPVRWTLPVEPRIYQAELVLDYGLAGFALDRLLLEVG